MLTHCDAILDLLREEIGEVIIVNLLLWMSYFHAAGIAAPPLGLQHMLQRQHQAFFILEAVDRGRHICLPLLRLFFLGHVDGDLEVIIFCDVPIAFKSLVSNLDALLSRIILLLAIVASHIIKYLT